ncbi:MAG: thiosulfate oxidation carrier protein SoxY [Methylococcales bacterium]|nr:thiosulfate oxidation carrier protein SoxY [Methylococcales bacterium]
MSNYRREFLKKTAVLTTSALAINTQSVHAQWLADSFSPNLLDGTVKTDIIDTDKIEIKLPKITGNGAAVPITVSSSLENIQSISILVEKNPVPLVAKFNLSAELDVFVSARIKMAETSNVIVLVKTHDGLYRAKEQVKVVLGGCGT